MILAMIVWLRHLLGWLVRVFRSRQDPITDLVADSRFFSGCFGFCCGALGQDGDDRSS